MKILHFIYDDVKNPWLSGGGAKRVQEIAKLMSKDNDITIITGNYPGAKNKNGKIKYKRVGLTRNYYLSRLSYALLAHTQLKNYDLVIDEISIYSPTLIPFFCRKLIGSVRDFPAEHALKKNSFGFIPFLIGKVIFKFYRNVICISSSVTRQVRKVNQGGNIKTITNGITIPNIKSKNENYVLYMGRIELYHKGLDMLVEAFKDGKQKLIIAGDGKDRNKLLELIKGKKNIKYIGEIHGRQKEKYLSECLCVCMPSRYEAWGHVALEAQSYGKSIVCFNIPGLKDNVNNSGILVKPYDVAELKKALIKIRNKTLRKKLEENARKNAINYRWEKLIAKRLEFYKKIAGEKGLVKKMQIKLNKYFMKKLPKNSVFISKVFTEDFDYKHMDKLQKKLNADNLYIVHGLAYKKSKNAVVLCGPAGIGKSTNLKKYNKTPIDDSVVVIMKKKDKYYVIETGCLYISQITSKYVKLLRSLIPFKPLYLEKNYSQAKLTLSEFLYKIINNLVSIFVKLTLPNRSNETHELKKYKIEMFYYIEHKQDHRKARDINNKTILDYKELAKIFKKTLTVKKLDFSQIAEAF